MKKVYIIPNLEEVVLHMDTLMQNVSGHTDSTLNNNVNFDNGKTDENADSRRPYNVWDDEEEEQQY